MLSDCQNLNRLTGSRGRLHSAHWLASSLKLAARCPVSGCLPSCCNMVSAILDLCCVCLDHPRMAFGGLCDCAKFGWNRCSRFDNMHVFRYHEFGLKIPIYAPKIGVLGDFTPWMESNINETQKGTSLHESTSFEPSCVKIRRRVCLTCKWVPRKWHKYILKISVIFHPFAQKPTVDGYVQIWHSCRGRRRNHQWQIFWQSVKGCWFCRRLEIAISHWLSQSPLTLGWRCRAFCDRSFS